MLIRIFPWRRFLLPLFNESGDACYYDPSQYCQRLGSVLQICEGYTVNLPDEVSDKLWKRTDYTWPCTWFTPRTTGQGAFKTAYDVMNNWGANHGAISYGHIGADLITLASILRIPVCMHNVRRKIFSDQLHGMHLVWIKRVRIIEHAQLMARFTNYKRLDTGVAAFNVRKSFVVTFQKSRKGCTCVR